MTITLWPPTAQGPAGTPARVRHAAAGASVACALVHVVLVAVGGRSMLAMSLPMLALSVLCLGCAGRARRSQATATSAWPVVVASAVTGLFHLRVEHRGHSPETAGLRIETAHLLTHAGLLLAAVQAGLVLLAVASTTAVAAPSPRSGPR